MSTEKFCITMFAIFLIFISFSFVIETIYDTSKDRVVEACYKAGKLNCDKIK